MILGTKTGQATFRGLVSFLGLRLQEVGSSGPLELLDHETSKDMLDQTKLEKMYKNSKEIGNEIFKNPRKNSKTKPLKKKRTNKKMQKEGQETNLNQLKIFETQLKGWRTNGEGIKDRRDRRRNGTEHQSLKKMKDEERRRVRMGKEEKSNGLVGGYDC